MLLSTGNHKLFLYICESISFVIFTHFNELKENLTIEIDAEKAFDKTLFQG